jgi:hypothetical protein
MGQYVDESGRAICLKFHGWAFWKGFRRVNLGSCRWGAECDRSHEPPSAATVALLSAEAEKCAPEQTKQAALEAERVAQATQVTALPDWLHAHRTPLVFPTDATPAFARMQVALAQILGIGIGPDAGVSGVAGGMSQMHQVGDLNDQTVPICPTLIHAFVHAGRKLPKAWKRAYHNRTAKMVQHMVQQVIISLSLFLLLIL